MNSRMEKYDKDTVSVRTKRNEKLYDNITELDAEYIDINNAIEIDSNKNSDRLTRSEYQRKKEIDKLLPSAKKNITEEEEEVKEDNRVYDINEILKLARENKLFENDDKKRLINTEYNILTKLDLSQVEETKDDSKENLRKLIDTIYGTSEKNNPEDEINKEKGGLLDDLLGDTDIVLTEETSKLILDKEDHFNEKEDTDDERDNEEKNEIIVKEFNNDDNPNEIKLDLNEDEDQTKEDSSKKDNESSKEEKEKDKDNKNDIDTEFIDIEIKRGKKVLIFIIIIVIILLLAGGYLFYKYFI